MSLKLSLILKELAIEQVLAVDPEIVGIADLAEATPSDLAYAMSEKHLAALQQTSAVAVFVPEALRDKVPEHVLALVVENPELSMARASGLFAKSYDLPVAGSQQIDPSAVIFPNVSLGSNVKIGPRTRILPGAYVGDDVVVGADCVVHPNCVIYHDCRIGDRCSIHANTVIGSDGFGYAHTKAGEHVKIQHLGNVIIEDDVEIGSNTSIDRAAFKSTIVRRGSKIDNLVHMAHNVEVGAHSIICGQTGIAGSTVLGRNVVMAAQSGATGHIKIADFTTIAGRGGVTKDTEPGKTYAGFPLMDHKQWLKLQGKLARLLKGK